VERSNALLLRIQGNQPMPSPAPAQRPAAPVAAAPCSFGVFERNEGRDDPIGMLDAVGDAGYAGIDLGPPGFLGSGDQLAERLEQRGLVLAGGWAQVNVHDVDLAELRSVLACFDAAGGGDAGSLPGPRPTLAAGEPERADAGRAPELDADDWSTFTGLLARAVATCRERGYEPVFHPHVGTFVETPEQTSRLLDAVDVPLCLDTGHLVLGGGDVATALEEWGDRITHVHLKDVHLDIARALAERGAPVQAIWAERAFCPLGAGGLDLDAMLRWMEGFDGWVVVEQDALVDDEDGWSQAARDQRSNRAWLGSRGW
jgi:inosose dehydratase